MNTRQKTAFENPIFLDLNRKDLLYREILRKNDLVIETVLTVRASLNDSGASWNVEMAVLDERGFKMNIRKLDGGSQSLIRHLGLELLDGVGVHDWRFVEYPDSVQITKSMSSAESTNLRLQWNLAIA